MKWLPAQLEIFRALPQNGRMGLLWRRQLGKTTTLAGASLLQMMDTPGRLVTFASASLLVGREVIEREAQILHQTVSELTEQAEARNFALRVHDREKDPKSDRLLQSKTLPAPDDFAELFEKNRLELRLYHSKTIASRTQIVAPNPATARGYTGCVMIDEIGWIPDFRDLYDAMIWIASRDPSFRVLMATTPPQDDAHFSYELLCPPVGTEFTANPNGNWYKSEMGLRVHRMDAWDADAAGVKLLDEETKQPLTPEQSRAKTLDKDGWDLNMGLRFRQGGTAAVSLMAITSAQSRGATSCSFVLIDQDSDLDTAVDLLKARLGPGAVGLGWDLATTENETSNPSSITVMEKIGTEYFARLILAWKTADPARAKLIARTIIQTVAARPAGGRARRLNIDATNERYFATECQREFAQMLPVGLVIGSETVKVGSEEMTTKAWLGNLLVNDLDEARLALPADRYVKEDFRLVKRNKGSFAAEPDKDGKHGDTFDSTKLAKYALMPSPGGAIEDASVIQIGNPKFSPARLGRGLA